MSFNAIYGGEPDARERARVMASIRRNMSESAAKRLLRNSTRSIDRIVAIPPGDLRLNRWDPRFRAASRRCTSLYLNKQETAVARLAGVVGALYQIRCNLVHGAKDPVNERDLMLVRECLPILEALMPELERAIA